MNWIKWTSELPPEGEEIIIAMRNKNMSEDGIWLYDICTWFGGDPDDKDNWEGKYNWETPVYWKKIEEPEYGKK